MKKTFDVIILGGGIVGLSLAACLQKSHLQIAIIDTQVSEHHWDKTNYSLRVSAINRNTENIFRQVDVWEKIIATRASAFNKIQVFDQTGTGKISFDRKDIAEPNLGYIIENCVMQKALLQQAKAKENIQYLAPLQTEDFWHGDNTIHLQLENGEELQAKLLVGADGANSWLRQRANFEIVERSYGQQALICTISTHLPHQQIARQWFLGDSILAFLPLAFEHECSIVWSVLPERAKQFSLMSEEQFCDHLTVACSEILGKIALKSERKIFPLSMRHAKNYVKPRIALVGDAAHTIHPLAGLGVNIGIADAAYLAEIISQSLVTKRDIGLLHTLRKYERGRKGDNTAMILAMDSFKNLFASEFKPLVWARNFGLNLTDNSVFLKQFFAKKALES